MVHLVLLDQPIPGGGGRHSRNFSRRRPLLSGHVATTFLVFLYPEGWERSPAFLGVPPAHGGGIFPLPSALQHRCGGRLCLYPALLWMGGGDFQLLGGSGFPGIFTLPSPFPSKQGAVPESLRFSSRSIWQSSKNKGF